MVNPKLVPGFDTKLDENIKILDFFDRWSVELKTDPVVTDTVGS